MQPTNRRTPQRAMRCLLLTQPPFSRVAREAARTAYGVLSVLRSSYYAIQTRRMPALLPGGVEGGHAPCRKASGATVDVGDGLGPV